ncbi:hypothetical protein QN366_05040 [Pseudomonas sp. CCC3.2]|uniref:hypothetical protein n=1 Tax=unclassified Pseudomonas TaxID=196821 RepID=UPI002AB3F316|nr:MULTISPECIES: hypothetical protein [unclassified Pseudomonas]MDY7559920.1 hypothetical protein [Pseudomonas sp. AB6]MEA9994574.1 hypothetical protein [Pseudomonas sp. AA4]MEB0085719.1 hypothetical protein [Pseudomonas sp. RTI1]MEB0125956.1 hypothetical protein [Pseudomonas sp. CCC1.2]MEB0152760.1 hypothetical protein [Pseudomonas sp. CCC4.3]
MSELKFTPGPWVAIHTPNGFVINPSTGGDSICRLSTLRMERNHEDNAKLIAAAPELLAALVELEAGSGTSPGANKKYAKARTAILKATA